MISLRTRLEDIAAGAVFACISLAPISTMAQTPVVLPFETDFEVGDNYSVGPLLSDAWWQLEPGLDASILMPGAASDQALSFLGGQSFSLYTDSASASVSWVDFYLKPVFVEPFELPAVFETEQSAVTGFVKIDPKGEVYVIDGDGQGGGAWKPSNVFKDVDGDIAQEWIRLTYRLDYTSKKWDLFVDGALVMTDLGFMDSSVTEFTSFSAKSDLNTATAFDYFYAGNTNPLFVDTANDGLPDDWLNLQGLSIYNVQRYGDSDLDGLTNLQEYQQSTLASNADSDGDGVNDGSEFFSGANPSTADAYALSLLPFTEDFESYLSEVLDSSKNWEVSGENVFIQSEDKLSGSFALEVGSASTASNFINGTQASVVWVDLYLKPTPAVESPDLKGDATVAYYFDDSGLPIVFDGSDGNGSGVWRLLDVVKSNDWRRITVKVDYAAQTYDFYIDDERLGTDLGFAHTQPYLSRFEVSEPTLLDNLTVSTVEPAGLDDDRDGATNAAEITAGTNPQAFDSDGDGLSDVLEVLWELDPNVADVQLAQPTEVESGVYTWATTFSNAEGYAAGALSGQNYWSAHGTANVTTGESVELEDSLTFDAVMERMAGVGEMPRVWISFRAKLVSGDLPSMESLAEPAVAIWGANTTGSLAIWNEAITEWESLNANADTADWNDYAVYLDYVDQFWTLCVNGIIIADNLPFKDTDLKVFSRFKALQSKVEDGNAEGDRASAEFDDITFSNAEPAGMDFDGDGLLNSVERQIGSNVLLADTDEDGLDDLWEYESGLNLLADDADIDADSDGLSNAFEYALGSDPQLEDSDADGYSDFEEYYARTDWLNPSEHPDGRGLPEPWSVSSIGNVNTPLAFQVGDEWRLAAAGKDQDNLGFFSRIFSGGYSVTFKFNEIDSGDKNRSIGLMLRNSVDTDAGMFATYERRNALLRQTVRTQDGGAFDDFQYSNNDVSGSFYLKMVRNAQKVTVYFSESGSVWRALRESYQDFPSDALVGAFLYSKDSDWQNERIRASIELVEVIEDTDFDGLYDSEELVLGTDLYIADSDGDGVSDYDEVKIANSDPLLAGTPAWSTFQTIDSSTGVPVLGSWNQNIFNELQIESFAGKIDIPFTLSEAGVYKLAIPVRYLYTGAENNERPLIINHFVDGEFVQTSSHLQEYSDAVDILEIYLPHLNSGEHVYQLHWENVFENRWVSLGNLELARPLDEAGASATQWSSNFIDASESLKTTASEFLVSPAFIEGRTRYLSMMSISGGANLQRAPGAGWFADLDLPDDGSNLDIVIAFQNEGKLQNTSLKWVTTDVLSSPDISLRTGDSLRLSAGALPDGSPVTISIGGLSQETIDDQAIIQTFDTPGEYVVNAVRGAESGSIVVTVYPTEVIADDPATVRSYVRSWTWNGLTGLSIDTGDVSANLIEDTAIDDDIELMRAEVVRPRVLAARLGGTEGPITQIVATEGFWLLENVEGVYQEEFVEEGVYRGISQLICSPLPDDVSIVVDIFKAGVMFEDGSTELTLTNADLDEFGRYELIMYKPESVRGSTCHQVNIYENGVYIHRR